MKSQGNKPPSSKRSGKKVYVWRGITVTLILVLGALLFYQNNSSIQKTEDPGSNQEEEIALQKTKETLRMVSEIMNSGRKDLSYLKEFNTTRERIIKHE